MRSMVDYAHAELLHYLDCDVAIDFTMGNGHDTLFLSRHAKEVYAFDIQEDALKATQALVSSPHVHLILDSHDRFDDYISHFDTGIFNLGYMPGGDHEVTTMIETTRLAVTKAVALMNRAIVIVVYVGHEAGAKESAWLKDYCSSVDPHAFNVSSYQMLNKRHAPYVITIEKR